MEQSEQERHSLYGLKPRPKDHIRIVTTNSPIHTKRDFLSLYCAGMPTFMRWQQAMWHGVALILIPPTSMATCLHQVQDVFISNFPTFNSGKDLYEGGLGIGNVEEGIGGVIPRAFWNPVAYFGLNGILSPSTARDLKYRTASVDIMAGAAATRSSKSKFYKLARQVGDSYFLRFYDQLRLDVLEDRIGLMPCLWIQCMNGRCKKWRCIRDEELFEELSALPFECQDQGRGHRCSDKEETEASIRREYRAALAKEPFYEHPRGEEARKLFRVSIATERRVTGDEGCHAEYYFHSNKGPEVNGNLIRMHYQHGHRHHRREMLTALPSIYIDATIGSLSEGCPVGFTAAAGERLRQAWSRRGGRRGQAENDRRQAETVAKLGMSVDNQRVECICVNCSNVRDSRHTIPSSEVGHSDREVEEYDVDENEERIGKPVQIHANVDKAAKAIPQVSVIPSGPLLTSRKTVDYFRKAVVDYQMGRSDPHVGCGTCPVYLQ